MLSTEKKDFVCSDFRLAAWLISFDIPVTIESNPRRPQRAQFKAPATDRVYELIAQYNSNGLVPVLTLLENIEVLKDKIMEIRQNGRAGAQ